MTTPSKKLTALYQGISGAHSNLALELFLNKTNVKDFQTQGVSTFRQVATDVLNGKGDLGIVPIDNAIAGTIRDGYDLLVQYDLTPIAEIEWKMNHRLLSIEGAELSTIREIFAHPLVLEECGRFLATLPGAHITPVEDTGLAAKLVAQGKDPSRAAIAPPEAMAIYGLKELAHTIADHPENFTRFMVFCAPQSKEVIQSLGGRLSPENRKTSLLLSTAHEKGKLAECLGILANANINLTKLESRPKLGKAWESLFYIDFEGDIHDPKIAKALEELQKHTVYFHKIGSYDRYRPHSSQALKTEASQVIAATSSADEKDAWSPELLPSSAKNWPKVSRSSNPAGTKIQIGTALVGGDDFVVIAGPCSVESREQVTATAKAVKERGAVMLRGGAFKPRTNPYAFQGMGWEGLQLLGEAGRATGLPIVSEVMSVDQVERMSREVDVLQIGARNMQNFDLLKAVGKTHTPVMLKRGMSASIDELLAAAEYILAEGNPHVMFCERGIRTFETATRNTLDLSAVPVLRERTHLPIIVDPSHGVGVKRWIRPLCRAAKAVGAHGMIVEVHPNPAEAKSDKEQALTFDDFAQIMEDLRKIPAYIR